MRNDFMPFKNKDSFFAMTGHIIFSQIDPINTVTHSKKMIKIIRDNIKFKNLIISDDLSMKSLKFTTKENTIRSFEAGCNLVLHCNGSLREMNIVADNSPKINSFVIKKTSEFYNFLS
jgi:beta-N-acetylhexosaminidase